MIPAPRLRAFGVALLVFAAVAPTLAWQEFSSGSENLNLATVLEMRRGGPWLVPTLQGQVRTQKPPLTAWITAAAVRPATITGLAETDPARRDEAYTRLAWQVRWTALLSTCAMLLAVYGMAKTIAGGDARFGLLSALICGTTLLFLRQARYATTDVQLALWVAVANFCLAKAILEDKWWPGCTIGGIALGLALMSKGPVALVQSIVPLVGFVAWRAWCRRIAIRDATQGARGFAVITSAETSEATAVPEHTRPFAKRPATSALIPVLIGVVLVLVVGLSWYAWVLRQNPGVTDLWVKEVTRVGAIEVEPDPWYKYFLLVPLVAPWSVFLVAGVASAVHALFERRGKPVVLALMLLVVPVLIMSFFKDRKDRYLLPMAPAAAILAARGLRDVWEARPSRSAASRGRAESLLVGLHVALLAAVAVGLPVLGATGLFDLKTREGGPWFTRAFAAVSAAGFAAIIGVGLVLSRRRPGALVGATATVMLLLQAVVMHGYVRSRQGRSEMKPLADAVRAAYPDAVTSYRYHRRVAGDLSIYLNRTVPQVKTSEEAEARARSAGGTPVLFMFHKRGRPEPDPEPDVPPGQKKWTFLARNARDEDAVVAFAVEGDGRK